MKRRLKTSQIALYLTIGILFTLVIVLFVSSNRMLFHIPLSGAEGNGNTEQQVSEYPDYEGFQSIFGVGTLENHGSVSDETVRVAGIGQITALD